MIIDGEEYYSRFTEQTKIWLLNERDDELYKIEKENTELKEKLLKSKSSNTLLEKKIKILEKKIKHNNQINLSSFYHSDFINVVHYMTADDGTDYYELEQQDIANELFLDSEYHIIKDAKVKVHIEIK